MAIGSILGAAGGPVSLGISLLPEAYRLFSGISQRNQGKRINPVDPGFVANPELADNARIRGDQYNNYRMPGYGNAVDNIDSAYGTAYDTSVQAASSGGDVLNAATQLAYGQGQALNGLAVDNAQGQEAALDDYLQAKAISGNELVRKNMFDLERYQQKLNEKAALMGAGTTNAYAAGDNVANAIRSFIQPQEKITQQPGAGTITKLPSIFG